MRFEHRETRLKLVEVWLELKNEQELKIAEEEAAVAAENKVKLRTRKRASEILGELSSSDDEDSEETASSRRLRNAKKNEDIIPQANLFSFIKFESKYFYPIDELALVSFFNSFGIISC